MEDRLTRALFGPGGNSNSFHAEKKTTPDAPEWVRKFGLDAYEFEAGRGLRTGEETLIAMGNAAKVAGIRMSYHAPYFISLSGIDPETRLKSIDYIEESIHAASLLGAGVIVVHTGSASKISRNEAMKLCEDTLYHTLERVDTRGVKIGLETMGKINQLGTLEEVIELCRMDPHFVPVVDFGHLNARELGHAFETEERYLRVFDRIGSALGNDIARNLHCHFSKIEWTSSGEKRHLTLEDQVYGPDFEPLMRVVAKEGLTPTFISESDGTQAEDALTMKKYYLMHRKEYDHE